MSQNFEQTYLQLRRAVLEKHFSRMNDKQREAVFQTEGPVLILAGAGSGKTTVVVNRIANMVQFGNAYHSDYVPAWVGEEDLAFLQDWLDDKLDDGDITRERLTRIVADRPVRPWNILAITFTNKAAGELKERLEAMLGEQALDIQASTFHSACMRILRREITALGYERSFTVYDTDDSVRIIKEALKELAVQEKVMAPKGILASISAAKDQLLSPEDVLREANGDYRQEVVGKVYSYYQKRLKAANALDFDDIIIFTVKIFQQYPDVLEKYRNRFRYIMVGLEAVSDSFLDSYQKHSSQALNIQTIRILHKYGINLVGLFIIDSRFKKEDFRNMRRFIHAHRITYTGVSIFTPIPGTPLFNEYRDRLTTENYEKWDFMHLVVKPECMSRFHFYFEYYLLIMDLFRIAQKAGIYSFLRLKDYKNIFLKLLFTDSFKLRPDR